MEKRKSADQPYRNTVVVQYHAHQGSITLKDVHSGTHKVASAWNTSWVKTVKDSGTNVPSFLFYGNEEHHLYDASMDKALNLPSFPL